MKALLKCRCGMRAETEPKTSESESLKFNSVELLGESLHGWEIMTLEQM